MPKAPAPKTTEKPRKAPITPSTGKEKAKSRGAKVVGDGMATLDRMKTRIVGHEEVSPFLLKPHRLNFRTHPESQMKALKGSMDELGWMRDVLVSKRTGTIIDGHARWEEAKKRKVMLPVCWLDLTPEEENKALALLDPISEMAGRNDALFMELLSTFEAQDAELQKTLDKMKPLKEEAEEEVSGGEVQMSTAILQFTTDVFFPSTTKFDVPDLKPDMLYDGPVPTSTWPYAEEDKGDPQFYVFGEGGFDERMTGKILTFYTDDWRFERIWAEAVDTIATVLPLKPAAAVQPDFSIWGFDPLAVQLYNLYRARWISRYWQEAGIKIIPSIAHSLYDKCLEFVCDGLPKDIPVDAIQIRSDGQATRQHVEARVKAVKHYLDYCNIGKISVYSTQKAFDQIISYLPKGPEYIRAIPFSDAWFINGQKMKAEKMAANLGITKEEAQAKIEREKKKPKAKAKTAPAAE